MRPRPALQACLGLMGGIACAEFTLPAVPLMAAALFVMLWGVWRFPQVWVLALAFCVGWARYTAWQAVSDAEPPNRAVLRAVSLLEPTRTGHRLLCTFEEPAIEGFALVYFRESVAAEALPDYGDRFVLEASWTKPRNWQGAPFDWARYLGRRRVRHLAFVYHAGQVQILDSGASLWQRRLGLARHNLRDTLRSRLTPETAAITEGMMMGATGDFPADLREAFMRSGIGHLLATSGLHVAMVLHMIGGALLWWGVPFRRRILTVIVSAWLYALLAGMRPSIVRASIMATLALSAPLVRREADSLSALGMAGLLWLLYAPYSLFEVGFQYSFSAVLCILLFYGRVVRWLNGMWQKLAPLPLLKGFGTRFLCPMLSVTLCAQLGIAPIQLYHFGYFGWLSTVANLLAVPVAYPLLALGFLFWFSQGWLGGVALEWLCGWLRWVALTFGSSGAPMLTLAHLPVWGVLGFYALLIALAPEPTEWDETLRA